MEARQPSIIAAVKLLQEISLGHGASFSPGAHLPWLA
jgi:hypothetical protein